MLLHAHDFLTICIVQLQLKKPRAEADDDEDTLI